MESKENSMVALPQSKTVYERFNDMVMPMIEALHVIVAIGRDLKRIDAKLSLEIGASLLLDKQVVLVVDPGTVVPTKLASLVTEIIYHDADDAKGMVAKIKELLDRMD
jgi:hypothetical protein